MNLHEAHEILGIDETVDAKQARRAYLRLLKQHRPESDPDGFQLIREAHELVATHRSMFGHSPSTVGQPAEEGGLPSVSPSHEASMATESQPGAEEANSGQEEAVPQEASPPPPSWLERTQTAVDQHQKNNAPTDWSHVFDTQLEEPPDPDEIWDLYYELEEDEHVAAELLRAASRAGIPGFEDSLVMTLPQLATEQELVAAQNSDYDSGTLFSVFLAAGDLERAGPAAVQALDTEHSDHISGYHLLELLFALESSGSERGGPLLFEKINEHIARELDERVLFAHCITSWMLTCEYFAMNFRLEPIGRVFVGDVCRTLDWDHAPELAMGWQPPAPHTRSSVIPPIRSVLSTYAPTLRDVLFPSAEAAHDPQPQMTMSGPGIPWWTTLFVLLGALRLLRACIPDDDTSETHLNTSQKMLQDTLREKERLNQQREGTDEPIPAAEKGETQPSDSELSKNETLPGDWFHLRKISLARFHQGIIADDCHQMNEALANLAWYQLRAPEDEKEMSAAENQKLNTEYAEQCLSEDEHEQE